MWACLLWRGLSHVAVCWKNWVTLVTGFRACQYAIHSFSFTRSVPSVLGPHDCLLSSCVSAPRGLHILLRALMSLACLSTSLPGSSCSASCRGQAPIFRGPGLVPRQGPAYVGRTDRKGESCFVSQTPPIMLPPPVPFPLLSSF